MENQKSPEVYCEDCHFKNEKSPKDILNENWKLRNLRLSKENKALRKKNNQLKRKIGKIHELSSGKHI